MFAVAYMIMRIPNCRLSPLIRFVDTPIITGSRPPVLLIAKTQRLIIPSKTTSVTPDSKHTITTLAQSSHQTVAHSRKLPKLRNKLLTQAISLSSLPLMGQFFSSSSTNMSSEPFPVQKSDQEWRAVLSREQFRIIREKGTEPPNSGEYEHTKTSGTYNCAACNFPLYKSTTKFDSGCGWPAFFEGIPGAIQRNVDPSYGLARTEIVCSNCGGHLGHVFKGEGYDTPTDERHCVNSVSLKLEREQV